MNAANKPQLRFTASLNGNFYSLSALKSLFDPKVLVFFNLNSNYLLLITDPLWTGDFKVKCCKHAPLFCSKYGLFHMLTCTLIRLVSDNSLERDVKKLRISLSSYTATPCSSSTCCRYIANIWYKSLAFQLFVVIFFKQAFNLFNQDAGAHRVKKCF